MSGGIETASSKVFNHPTFHTCLLVLTICLGTDEIIAFLTRKWEKEHSYRLRKELFAFSADKIAVQFFYEYEDAHDNMKWKRCYGLEDWTFATEGEEAGKMRKRMMSGNDVLLGVDGDGVGKGNTGEHGWVEGRWFVKEDGALMDTKEVDGEKVTAMLTERHL